MSQRRSRRPENHEGSSFEKLIEGLRMAEEGAAEYATHKSDPRFMTVASRLQITRQQIVELANMSAARGIRL